MKFTGRVSIAGAALAVSALVAVGIPAGTAVAGTETEAVAAGMQIVVDETLITAATCTLGAVVSPTKALTAAHCGDTGQAVYSTGGDQIGTITANLIGRQVDIAVITLSPGVHAEPDSIAWGATFAVGQPVSKDGATSGFTAGTVTDAELTPRVAHGFSLKAPFFHVQTALSIGTDIYSLGGDSGAGIRDADGNVVGILSSGATVDDTQFSPVSLVPAAYR